MNKLHKIIACLVIIFSALPYQSFAQPMKTTVLEKKNTFTLKETLVTSQPIITSPCNSTNSGDLAQHMSRALNTKISLVTNTTNARSLWTTRPNTLQGTFVRNPTLWTSLGRIGVNAPLNFSGVSPMNIHPLYAGHMYQKSGTLISPRHVVMASHYHVTVGAKMMFVAPDGTSHERTLTAVKSINDNSDITVGILDRDLPSTIATYEVIDYNTYAKKIGLVGQQNPEVLMASLNQDGQVFLHALQAVYRMGYAGDGAPKARFSHIYFFTPVPPQTEIPNTPSTPMRLALTGAIRDGDSGHPNFVVINNRLVLMGIHMTATTGDVLGARALAINAAMKELGGGYQLKIADLSCFTDYR